jgi:Response regulator of the LytR/AlgR family
VKQAKMQLRVLIVDDEPIAREGVRVQLSKHPDVEIVAECADGLEAVEAIRDANPEIVFLDVQMPGMDGFEVLQHLDLAKLPAIVFVTAYDKYALKAFDVNAVDYLLKPFDAERFEKAFTRAKAEVTTRDTALLDLRLRKLIDTVRPAQKHLERLVVKSRGRIFFLRVEEIDWIAAADNYVDVHLGRESHLIRETLTALEAKLDPGKFVRIRHSVIINIDHIKELHPLFKGAYEIVLMDGTRLKSSRRYYNHISELLES